MKDWPKSDEEAMALAQNSNDTEEERALGIAVYRYFRSNGWTVQEAFGQFMCSMMQFTGMVVDGPDLSIFDTDRN
jgi:hypothetical protein